MATVQTADVEAQVRRLAAPVVDEMGLEIVEAVVQRRGQSWRLRLDIDRPGPEGVRLDDCGRVSGAVEAALDDSGLLGDAYLLEVSSPGLDRPIRTDDDIRRNTGRVVVVETREPVEGRTAFEGVLLGMDGDALRLRESAGEVRLPRSAIARAHQEIAFK